MEITWGDLGYHVALLSEVFLWSTMGYFLYTMPIKP